MQNEELGKQKGVRKDYWQ